MYKSKRKAFTMIELVFVIVVIGILSAIAVPKFAATADDARITRAKATVASIRSAIGTERQQRLLRGNFDKITTLSTSDGTGANKEIFDGFDGNGTQPVLQYPLLACETAQSKGCWIQGPVADPTLVSYIMPLGGAPVVFELKNNTFKCLLPNSNSCKKLTR